MARTITPRPPKEELEEIYSRKSLMDVSLRYSTSTFTVKKWLTEYGIPIAPPARGTTQYVKKGISFPNSRTLEEKH